MICVEERIALVAILLLLAATLAAMGHAAAELKTPQTISGGARPPSSSRGLGLVDAGQPTNLILARPVLQNEVGGVLKVERSTLVRNIPTSIQAKTEARNGVEMLALQNIALDLQGSRQ